MQAVQVHVAETVEIFTTAVEDFAGAVHGQRVAAPVMQAVQMHVAETTWTEGRSSCHAGCPKYTSRIQSRSHKCSEKIRWCSKWTEGRCSCHAGCPSTRRGDSRDLTTAVKKFAGAVNGQRVAVPVMQAVPSTRRGDSRDRTTAVKKFAGAVNGQRVAVPVMQAVQVHVAETVEISQLQWKISLVQYMDRGSLFLSCRLSKCTSRRLHGQKVAVPVMQAVPSARRGDSRDRTTAVKKFAGAINGQRVAVPVMQAVQVHVAETTWTEGRSSCHAGCPKYTSRRQSEIAQRQ